MTSHLYTYRVKVTERTFATITPQVIQKFLSNAKNITLFDERIKFLTDPVKSNCKDSTVYEAPIEWDLLGIHLKSTARFFYANWGMRMHCVQSNLGIGLKIDVIIRPFAGNWSDVLCAYRLMLPLFSSPLAPFIKIYLRNSARKAVKHLEDRVEHYIPPRLSEQTKAL